MVCAPGGAGALRGTPGGAGASIITSASGEGDALSDTNGSCGGAGGIKMWPGMCGGGGGEGGGATPSTVLP